MQHVAEELAVPFAETVVMDGEVDSEAAKMHAELSGRMAESVWFTSDLTERVLRDEREPSDRATPTHERRPVRTSRGGPTTSPPRWGTLVGKRSRRPLSRKQPSRTSRA